MEQFTPIVLMATLIGKILDLVKFARARDLNGVVTQVAAFVAGVVVVLLAAQTDYAAQIAFGDVTLATANVWTLIFIGLLATSLFSTLYDFKKALDHTDTAMTPRLTQLPSASRDTAPHVTPPSA